MAADDNQLRSVFDLCSPDSDGYILTDYLADKLAEQFNDQALATVQDALDPERIGRISFHQFCDAVKSIQDKQPEKETIKPTFYGEEDDSSDPENTYNEYDIAEDEISEMENLEAIGESPHTLSPIKTPDSEYFQRHGSFRRSHRRARSWTIRSGLSEHSFHHENGLGSNDSSTSGLEYEDLSDKVDKLQGHLSQLTEEKNMQTQYEAVKRENNQLTNQVNELEEKLQDSTERCDEVKKTYQFKLQDVQREHELEIQVLQSKIEVLASDKERLNSELTFAKHNAKEARETLTNLQSQSDSLTKQIMETNEEYRRLNQRFTLQQDKHEFQLHKLNEEIEGLKQQIRISGEENAKMKSELENRTFDPSSARIRAHVDNLKAENDELKKNNQDLTDQLAQNISEARLLMCGGDQSIAQELSSATRDEVMDALKKQEHINDQLRCYLERITLNILERDPGILEIK